MSTPCSSHIAQEISPYSEDPNEAVEFVEATDQEMADILSLFPDVVIEDMALPEAGVCSEVNYVPNKILFRQLN